MIEKELTDKKFEFINDKDKQFIIKKNWFN